MTLATMMPSTEAIKDTSRKLYDAETRPEFVGNLIQAVVDRLGAEKVVDAKAVEYVASLSTADGLKAGTNDLSTIAAPYIAKARSGADGRAELVVEAKDKGKELTSTVKELTSSMLVKPASEYATTKYETIKEGVYGYAEAKYTSTKELAEAKYTSTKTYAEGKLSTTKELAAPYVEKAAPYVAVAQEKVSPYVAAAHEKAAPYLAKLDSKREEITSGKRYEAAMAKLAQLRAHPRELASELKASTIDLIKYDDVKAYRDHVMSKEFQADTLRLLTVDLPAIATSAATRGAQSLKSRAAALSDEITTHKALVSDAMGKGYEAAKEVDLLALRAGLLSTGASLLSELHAEAADGYMHLKKGGLSALTIADSVARIKRVIGIFDKVVVGPTYKAISPIISRTSSSSGLAPTAAPTTTTTVHGFAVSSPNKTEADAATGADDEDEAEAEGEEEYEDMDDSMETGL